MTGAHKISNGRILFPGEFSLEIRSPVTEIITRMASSLIPGTAFELDRQAVMVVESRLLFVGVDAEVIHIRMQSPIVVYRTMTDKRTRYYEPTEPEFAELVNRNFETKYEAFTGNPPDSNIRLYDIC